MTTAVTANAITTYFAISLDILDPATSQLKFRAEICFKVAKIVFRETHRPCPK